MTHDTKRKTGIERRGVLMAKGRDDHKGSAPHEYNQIRMTEDDKEKNGFHMEEGVCCFTHMPKELKNSAATLQRMMEEVLVDQKGWNVEIYLEDIVIKRKRRRSYVLLVEREGIQIPVSYVSRPLQGMEICYTPMKKMVQTLIHTTRSLRAIFRKHKVKVITDGPMEKILKLFRKEGRLAKWVAEIRTYDISYIPRREAEGSVVKKFFGQEEQVEETLDPNEGGTLNLSRKLQAKSIPTPRSWRLYLGRETIEKGSGVGIILVNLEEKMYSYAIRLKFNASNHAMNCEVLLTGLAISVSKGMKNLHIFMDSPNLVAQTEGNHMLAMKQERKYKKEIIDATAPFHRFRITHLPKLLNFSIRATIKLEFLNQEVSVGIKTRPSMEETSSSKKGKATSNVPSAKPNYNWEASGSNRTDA
ncbi:reverse transcriptase domain-containing protein [Tanacetum coccineum]|uniref:Reverse transcriptase domain-containing protein n=1 Tax=Tanacetum coccineum TaxID=301880 RepID=A0ABQ5A2Q8_9ASTR